MNLLIAEPQFRRQARRDQGWFWVGRPTSPFHQRSMCVVVSDPDGFLDQCARHGDSSTINVIFGGSYLYYLMPLQLYWEDDDALHPLTIERSFEAPKRFCLLSTRSVHLCILVERGCVLHGILRLSSCLQRQCIHSTIIPGCESSALIKASQSGFVFFHANLSIDDNVRHCGTG